MVLFRRLLGDVLRDKRTQRGLTLREVSADARVSLGYISEIERGQKEASSELLASLCDALEVPLSDVLREVSDAVAVEEAACALPTSIPSAPPRRRGRLRRLRPLHPSARTGWQAGHQYAVRSRPASPRSARWTTVPQRRHGSPLSAVDPQVAAATLVAGGAIWGGAGSGAASSEPGRPSGAGRRRRTTGGTRDVAGEEAELGAVDGADAGEVALVEQRLAERAVGVGRQPADGLVLVPVGAEQVGPEVADDLVLVLAQHQLDDAELEPDADPVADVEDDPGRCGRPCSTARPGA